MPTYYDQEYWSLSEKERLWRARDIYRKWKRIVSRGRAQLSRPQVVKFVVDSGFRFVDVWGRITETGPIIHTIKQSTEIQQRQYLADYKRYLMALLEYERLKASTEVHDPYRRPTTAHRQAPVDTPRGPAGVSNSTDPPVSEPDVMDELKKKFLQRLRKSIERAKKLKTDESIADVIEDVAEAQRRGYDEEGDDALSEMADLAQENLDETMRQAARKRTRDSVKDLLDDMVDVQILPGDDQTEEAYQLAGDILEELDEKAEEWFRKKPTRQRFRFRLRRMADAQYAGRKNEHNWLEGVNRRRSEDSYQTKPGDTLSKIALDFYGDASRWDVIYIENSGTIEDDPDRILPNITLQIP